MYIIRKITYLLQMAVAMATLAVVNTVLSCCVPGDQAKYGEEVNVDDPRPVPHTRVSLSLVQLVGGPGARDKLLLGGAQALDSAMLLFLPEPNALSCGLYKTLQVLRLCAPVQIPDRRDVWLSHAQSADRPQGGFVRQSRPRRHSALAEQDHTGRGGTQQPSVLLPYP